MISNLSHKLLTVTVALLTNRIANPSIYPLAINKRLFFLTNQAIVWINRLRPSFYRVWATVAGYYLSGCLGMSQREPRLHQ